MNDTIDRREFLVSGALATTVALTPGLRSGQNVDVMYGMIGKIQAVAGQRDALAEILVDGVAGMPGCLSYVVAKDTGDPDALWVTEVWDRQESHAASLSMPSVEEAIRQGRPLIAGFSERHETEPVGGHGLD